MKKLIVLCLLLCSFTAKAQTTFNKWDIFKSDRFGITMNYPDSWIMNEKGNAEYVFKNEIASLGTFNLKVEEKADSASATESLKKEEQANGGANFNKLADRCIVMYKTVAIMNGNSVETHHWVISSGNKVLHCAYSFEAKKRNDANMKDEILLAYQMIESISFYKV